LIDCELLIDLIVICCRPSVSSSLQITNHSFRYASSHPWNQLPSLHLRRALVIINCSIMLRALEIVVVARRPLFQCRARVRRFVSGIVHHSSVDVYTRGDSWLSL